MRNLTFVIGGARSGKSAWAIKLARAAGNRIAFIATAQAEDEEMARRIRLHRKNRPAGWKTIEETRDLASAVKRVPKGYDGILIDCLTLLVSNLMLDGRTDAYIEESVKRAVRGLKRAGHEAIIVSNEVGFGVVPDNKLARRFRDLAGRINQMVGGSCGTVWLVTAGIPVKIKERG